MQPYVIQQGDYLEKLAHRQGFDAEAVWNDPKNESLRDLRKNHNLLCPGDVLYVPEPKRVFLPVSLGSRNKFRANVPTITVKIAIKRGGQPLKGEAFAVRAGAYTTGGTTSGDGTASFDAPVNAGQCTLTVTRTGQVYRLFVGHMDPPGEGTGAWKRLEHLGYLAGPRETLPDATAIAALKRFQSDSGLPTSGEMDEATLAALEAAHGS